MSKSDVSVVIPTFNRAELVVETVESCLNQSNPPREIIVVDDGSTDITREVLAKYSTIEGFCYIYQENQGRSVARNKGLELATSDYVIFLDSDDVLLNDGLHSLMAAASEHPDSGLIAGVRQIVSEDLRLRYPIEPELLEREYYDEDMSFRNGRYAFFVPSCFVVKRAVALEVGGFDPEVDMSEDLDFCLKSAEVTKFSAIPVPVVLLRRHEGNTPGHEHRIVSIKVKTRYLKKLALLRKEKGTRLNQITGLWHFKIASDHYQIGQFREALDHYLLASWFYPRFLIGGTKHNLSRQILATTVKRALRLFRPISRSD